MGIVGMGTKMKRFIMLLLAVTFLAASGFLVEPLRYTQVKYDLTNAPVKGVAPGVVLATTVLGAFRGIIVDIVWIRMESLKGEGKYFEIVQLADLACRLAPNFPQVWDFNAWNMAYNVSVKLLDFNERWLWVKRGLEILRDQGIPNNANEPQLYFSLGMTYLHKVGGHDDNAHFVYKEGLGLEMHEALGGSGTQEDLQRFANAPTLDEGLLEDPRVKEFCERSVALGFDPLAEIPDERILRFFVWVRRPESIPQAAAELWQAEENQYAVGKIADYARAKRLREQLHLEPQKMKALMDEFGPLDWRSPFPHAMYWATEGLRAAQTYKKHVADRRRRHGIATPEYRTGADVILYYPEFLYHDRDYDRIIYGALDDLVTRGRLIYDGEGRILPMEAPDYRFTEKMIQYYEKVIAKYGDSALGPKGTVDSYGGFLKTVTIEFYYRGDEAKSRDYFKRLIQRFGGNISYEEFIDNELRNYIGGMGPAECRGLVQGLISMYYFYLACGDDEQASVLFTEAQNTVNMWQQKNDQNLDRLTVDLDMITDFALTEIFAGRAGFAPEVIARLEQRLPIAAVEKAKKTVAEQEKLRELQPLRIPEERRWDPR